MTKSLNNGTQTDPPR